MGLLSDLGLGFLEKGALDTIDRDIEEQGVRGSERAATRAAGRGVDREASDKAAKEAADKTAKEAAEKTAKEAADKKAEGWGLKKGGAVVTALGGLTWALMTLGFTAAKDAADFAAALLIGVVTLVVALVLGFVRTAVAALSAPEQPQRLALPARRGRFIKPVSGGGADASIDQGGTSASREAGSSSGVIILGMLVVAVIIAITVIYFWESAKRILLRDKLKEYLDENSLSMVQVGLDKDTSTDEICSKLNSPDKGTCDRGNCILNEDSTRCISCKEWLKSFDPESDDDDEETLSKMEKYALYGILTKKAYSKIVPKFIKSRVASAFTKAGSGAMRLVKELILKLIVKSAEEMAERVAAGAGRVLAAEATILAAAAETGPLDVAIGVGMAIVDVLMIYGMVAEAVDVSSYRSYISNTDLQLRRNQMDASYLRSIAINHSLTDNTLPPISDQKPSMYQLDTMVHPLQNSNIPGANILLIIGEAYTEARIAWILKVLNLTPDEIEARPVRDEAEIAAHDDFVRIQKKGHKAQYLPPSVLADAPELQFINENLNNEVSDYSSTYTGGFCQYEIDSHEYLDKFINSRSSERDTFFLTYIQEYMGRYVSIDTAHDNLQNNTDENSENIWNSSLPTVVQEMISYHAGTPSRIYKASDLIKDYGNGTTKISGISLTEIGCILLNQILDYESYIYPYRKQILDKDPMFPLPNSVQDQDLQGLKSYQLPKVVYSEYHRVIVPGTDGTTKIISILNPTGADVEIKLPLYYPSTTMNEMACKYGYQALKLGSKKNCKPGDGTLTQAGRPTCTVSNYKTTLALGFMAKGTGGDEDDLSNELLEGGDPWLPLLYGVSFDQNIGLCKYDPRGTGFTDESYCTRMGRSTTSQVYENPGSTGNQGQKYTICDESECDSIGCMIIGAEHLHDWDRYTTDFENMF